MDLLVNEKQIVVPGEVLATGMKYMPAYGTYRKEDKIYAQRLGLVEINKNVIKIIPVSGKYLPKENDFVIAKVTDIMSKGWMLDINCAYHAMLPLKDATSDFIPREADLSRYFDVNDMIFAKISKVSSQFLVDISNRDRACRKLKNGRIIKCNPNKVPRIIGKQGSMISILKKYSGCDIVVGQNGLIFLSGEPKMELIIIEMISYIQENSHLPGLTVHVEDILKEKTKDFKIDTFEEQNNFENNNAPREFVRN
jgi:exosome complex component RRP4